MIIRFERNGKIKYGWVVEDRVRVIEGNIFNEDELTVMTGLEVPSKDVKLFVPSIPKQMVRVADHQRNQEQSSSIDYAISAVQEGALVGSNQRISLAEPLPALYYGVSIGFIIKRAAEQVAASDSDEYIMGVTTALSIHGRGQEHNGVGEPLVYCVGPGIVPKLKPNELEMKLIINGDTVEILHTSEFCSGFASLLSEITRDVILNPGDIVLAGTWVTRRQVQLRDQVKLVTEGFEMPLLGDIDG